MYKKSDFAVAEEIIETKSNAVYLKDAYSDYSIMSKNEEKHYPIASMCKVMTLLLCFEEIDNGNISLEDKIIVSENASKMGGSQVFLGANEEYKIGDLIKSIVVASANDASVAMAEKISGSEQLFVDKMNEKCKELGMNNTCFTNCTGLPKEGQFSCAKDVCTMFSELIKHKDYFKFSHIWMDRINHAKGRYTEISNTNKLIRFYDGCLGGKTGYTSEAGHCLVALAERNGTALVGVVIHAPDSKTRFKEISSMFNYGFANYVNKIIVDNNKSLDYAVNVENGEKDTIEVKAKDPVCVFTKKDEKRSFDFEFVPNSKITAPLLQGDVVGKIMVYENGFCIKEIEVVSCESVEKASYYKNIKNVIDRWGTI